MKYFFLTYLILFSLCSFGQNQQQIDSLKISDLEKKASSFVPKNNDSTFYYYNKIINYSNQKKYIQGSFIGYDLIANLYYNNGKYEAALTNAEKSYSLTKELKNKELQGRSENLLAFIYLRLNDYTNAEFYSEKALQNGLEKNDIEIISNAYLVRGNIHYIKFENNKALDFYHKIDSITSKKEDYNTALIKALANAGNLVLRSYSVQDTSYISVGESYFKRARDIAKTINNKLEENYAIKQLGKIYAQRGNYKTAISYFLLSLEYYKKNNNIREMSNSYWILGVAYNQLRDLDKAAYYYKKRIALYENTANKMDLAKAYASFGGFQYYNNDFEKAIPNLRFGLNLLDSLNYKSLGNMMAYNYELGQSYAHQKNYKNAFTFLDKAFTLKDSLKNNEQNKLTLELETKYQTEKKEHEIELLKSQNELAERQKTNQRNVLLGGLVLTSIAGLFLFVMYRNRQKTNTKLKELDALKSNFFTNISHEFRTPLTLISAPIQDALNDASLSKKKRSQFEMAQRNSERLLSLVNQLLDLSKIDGGNLKLHVQEGNVLQLISALSDSFSYLAEQKEINYLKEIETNDIKTWFDKDAIEKIIINLLANAIKYTPNKGSVVCSAFVKDGKLNLEVKNTGTVLTTKELNSIFQRFYQTNEQNQGSGIGLALVKELIELHKGSITVTSKPNKWTTFNVILPINKSDFNSEQIILIPNDKAKVEIPIISNPDYEIDGRTPVGGLLGTSGVSSNFYTQKQLIPSVQLKAQGSAIDGTFKIVPVPGTQTLVIPFKYN